MITKPLQISGNSSVYTQPLQDIQIDETLKKTAHVQKMNGIDPTANTQKNHESSDLRKLSEEFEALFLGMVLKSMRDSVQKSGLIDGGNAENIYRSMLDDEYAKQMAAQHHTGLADQIADFLSAQNHVKGRKAYNQQELPEPVKQATIKN